MRNGHVLFNGNDLSLLGRAGFTQTRSAEASRPERASHYEVTLTVTLNIEALAPSTARAKLTALQATLDTHEGQLVVKDENGFALSWLAQPTGDNINDVLNTGRGAVILNFLAREEIATSDATGDATFRPHDAPGDGSADIFLYKITGFQRDIRTTRPDERHGGRTLTTTSITLQGQTAWADQSLSYPARLAFLETEKANLEALNTRDGLLTRGTFSDIVQVESLTIRIGGNAEFLSIALQARHVALPDATTAEVDFTLKDTEDWGNGKMQRSLTATIEAENETIATAKANALLVAYTTAGFRLRKKELTPKILDGYDQSFTIPTITQWGLSIDWTRDLHLIWSLDASSEEGSDGNTQTFSGSVKSTSLATATATIPFLIGSPSGTLTRSTRSIKTISEAHAPGATTPNDPNDHDSEFIEITFSDTYRNASTLLTGNATREVSTPAFGEYTTRVSGDFTAASQGAAETKARSLIDVGVRIRENTESTSSTIDTGTATFTKFTFNYGWRNAHSETSLKYNDTLSPDYTKMVANRSLQGTVRAADKATAEAALTSYLAAYGNALQLSVTTGLERHGTTATGADYTQTEFSVSYQEDIAGTPAHDIIEAHWSLERIGQITHSPINTIPCGPPVKQILPGSLTIGSLTASGNISARLEATARNWGQAKRSAAINFGGSGVGAEKPPRERMEPSYKTMTGTGAVLYNFSFTYSADYATGLTGIWPGSGMNVT